MLVTEVRRSRVKYRLTRTASAEAVCSYRPPLLLIHGMSGPYTAATSLLVYGLPALALALTFALVLAFARLVPSIGHDQRVHMVHKWAERADEL